MSKIEELIEKLCPNGVKFEELKEICMVSIGEFVHKNKQREDAKYPVFNGGISNTGFYDEYNNEGNKILISARGANAGFINKIESRYWAGNSCYSIDIKDKGSINWLYVYYYLKNNEKSLLGQQQTGSIPAISKKQIESFKIPVPPLEVQCEIVHILDDFTLLSAELSAELKARQKQYEYYENELFDFDNNNIEYTKIDFEEIATFSQGIQVDVNKQYYEPFENRVPFLRIVDFVNDNEPPRYIEKPNDKYIKKENEMIMIRYGASAAGKVFLNKYGAIANNMFKINLKEKSSINLKYLMYYLSQNKIYKLLNSSGKSTMPAINFGFLGKLKIDIPSIKEQERIVNTLDRFDKLCNDISEGLPAEIEARQKQYEYYRDKLLTFKELKVNE